MRSYPIRAVAWLTSLAVVLALGLVITRPLDVEAAKRPTSVTLSPTADPARSQTFTWRVTKKRSGQYVQLRAPNGRLTKAPARYKMKVSKKYSGFKAYAYTATATRLTPATRYAYRIVTSRGSTGWSSFTTARAGLDRPWTFLAFGDTQLDNAGLPEAIIDRAVARHPSAPVLLHVGDVVDKPHRASEWRAFQAATHPTRTNRNWLISVGNHEQCDGRGCRSGKGQAFRSYYTWPRNGYPSQGATWYATDYQGVRFIALDTFGGDLARQSAFLDWALRTNRQRWTVVIMHSGPFSSFPTGNNTAMRKYFLPRFIKYDVDLVLSGHDHAYVRGYHGRSGNSTVYAVSNSGPKFFRPSATDWRRGGARVVTAAARTATYQTVTVDRDTLVYRAVVAHKARGASTGVPVGGTLDGVTITKTAVGKTVR